MRNDVFTIACLFFFFMACSKNPSETDFFHYDTSLSYNENLLVLDSISACIDDELEWERFFKQDSVFIERQGDKEIIVLPSQLNTLRKVVKSIGIHSFGDTLKIELIEKEKSSGLSLDCPVWVYGSLNGELDGKYIRTFTGVYVLVKD